MQHTNKHDQKQQPNPPYRVRRELQPKIREQRSKLERELGSAVSLAETVSHLIEAGLKSA